MTHALVDSLDKVIENIARYQNEVIREPGLVGRMTMVRPWYADRANDGKWLFGPSKFVGYASCTAEAYLSKTDKRDTYRSEAVLKEWFDIVPSASPLEAEVADALRRFLNAYGHSGPRKNAWICARKDFLAGSADSVSSRQRSRTRRGPGRRNRGQGARDGGGNLVEGRRFCRTGATAPRIAGGVATSRQYNQCLASSWAAPQLATIEDALSSGESLPPFRRSFSSASAMI